MFLLQRIEFIALIGLFVQAFLAWIFVAILATMRRGEKPSGAFDNFYFAFVALAVALTVLSARFFQAHEVALPFWTDGQWAPTLCYAVYQGLKGIFGVFLVRGSYALAEKTPPRWLSATFVAVVLLLALSPLWKDTMTPLLIVQAPVMIGCSLAALHPLLRARNVDSGIRVVRWSLVGLAIAWTIDATAAGLHQRFPSFHYVLAANSYLDMGVQLSLGTGLVVSLLQATHARMRASELERERLQRVLERDEKLRALGTLLSGVAHELNNPLTVILGYADLISATEENSDAAKIVAEQAQRCRGIVRNLSALAGQSQHPLQELDVAELALRVVRGFQPDPSAVARIRVAPLSGLRIVADRIGMEQVLSNLVSNALQAGDGPVTIEASPSAAGVRIAVTDEGPGIPHELRSRLFEPFFTTKGPGKGTGLGLSIAHAIVRAHNGTISVEDGPRGKGARFEVLIPHGIPTAQNGKALAQPARRARRLLIVDDDAAVRSIVRRQAELRGFTVVEADSAEAALAGATPLRDFDALLCDLRMPGMGGAGLHDWLREKEPAALARTVFVTGELASSEAVQFSARCRRPLIEKPFEFDELFAALDAHEVGAER